jgi:HEXXH motif-containing protein
VRAARFAIGAVTLVTDRGEETHADRSVGRTTPHDARPDFVTRPYRAITADAAPRAGRQQPAADVRGAPRQGRQRHRPRRARPPTSGARRCARPSTSSPRTCPTLRAEIDLFLHLAVPVGYDDHKHLSASYQEALGTIYLTLHPNLMTMTEAVIHEFSHNKLNALLELDPLLENAFWPLYASPVRPDPRPLHGVLLAVHAFQPVARLYERMTAAGHPRAQSADFQRRFAQIRRINHAGAEVVLAHGRPTETGRALLDEMRRWDDHYGAQEP